jgi:hypothetical protein
MLSILVGFWGKGEGGVPLGIRGGGKGKEKTFSLYPLTFSPNPMPS